jgi:beta-fructofuranosidase
MFGWLREERPPADLVTAGWAGAMSVPRILTARPDGTLGYAPAPEMEALRGAHLHLADVTVTPDARDTLGDLRGNCMEIVAEFVGGDAERFGLIVGRSPDGAEETRIVYDRTREELLVDRTRSSTAVTPERPVVGGACPLDAGDTLRLHIFLDGSIVEIFANGRACLTARVYPSQAESIGVDLFAQGGVAHVQGLNSWQLVSVWDAHGQLHGGH